MTLFHVTIFATLSSIIISTPRKKDRLAENVMFKENDPLAFQYHYTLNLLEEWKKVDLRRRGKHGPPNMGKIEPLPLFTSPSKIKNMKQKVVLVF